MEYRAVFVLSVSILLMFSAFAAPLYSADALIPGPGANQHLTARYAWYVVCGDQLCNGNVMTIQEKIAAYLESMHNEKATILQQRIKIPLIQTITAPTFQCKDNDSLTDWYFNAGLNAKRPAILLFHGLGMDANAWQKPSQYPLTSASGGFLRGGTVAYDRTSPPVKGLGDHDLPNAGFFEFSTSDTLYGDNRDQWDSEHSWVHYLHDLRGFTVATWSQRQGTFFDAYPSTVKAFNEFATCVNAYAKQQNVSPPPIALIGHSRGGLLIRELIKDNFNSTEMQQVRWVITLHSPNQGTDLARGVAELFANIVQYIIAGFLSGASGIPFDPHIIPNLSQQLNNFLAPAFDFLNVLLPSSASELATNAALIGNLAEGEKPLPQAAYYTFGGINPNFFHLYAWFYDPMSAVPQYKCSISWQSQSCEQYFEWNAKPVDLVISPFDRMPAPLANFVAEWTTGKGDGVVSDDRSKLPWGTHITDNLNHFEVLWDPGLQNQVGEIIEPLMQLKSIR